MPKSFYEDVPATPLYSVDSEKNIDLLMLYGKTWNEFLVEQIKSDIQIELILWQSITGILIRQNQVQINYDYLTTNVILPLIGDSSV